MHSTGGLGFGLPLILNNTGNREIKVYYVCPFVKMQFPCKNQDMSSQAKDLIVIMMSGGRALQRDRYEELGKLGSHKRATMETNHRAGATLLTCCPGERGEAQVLSGTPVPLLFFPSKLVLRHCIFIQSVLEAT